MKISTSPAMPKFNLEDINLQTVLVKAGDRSFTAMVCPSLAEAVIEVARWSEAEQAKARFRITGKDKGYEYSWAEIPVD
ncbi:MAG: hypothetical protein WA776_14045 [Xanthobacteraceae bacterium]